MSNGQSAVELAEDKGHEEIAQLLEEKLKSYADNDENDDKEEESTEEEDSDEENSKDSHDKE